MDRQNIVSEALKLTEEQGLEALSLRTLAQRLGVKAPSLYWHVTDKQDLRAAMGDRLLRRCLANMPACEGWEAWLLAFGRQLWLTQVTMRDSGALLMAVRANAEGAEILNRDIAQRLGQFGLDYAEATRMQWAVQALVTGWLAFQQAGQCEFEAVVEASTFESLATLVNGWAAEKRLAATR